MRNYITRSFSAAQILRESYQEVLDENGRYVVTIICEANRDMEQLIDDMLVLSRVTGSEIRRKTADLGMIAGGIAADLQLAEPERSVAFAIAPGLVAPCDPHLIKIALENLFGNAWKYTRRVPDPRVEFGVIEHGDTPAFFVRDNGMGFDMKDADHLFQPFQRLRNAREFPGTGIGLATVRRIIQRHGGEVWGEGEPGKGAVFYFTLSA